MKTSMRHLRPNFALKTSLRQTESEKRKIKYPWVKTSLVALRVGKHVETYFEETYLSLKQKIQKYKNAMVGTSNLPTNKSL